MIWFFIGFDFWLMWFKVKIYSHGIRNHLKICTLNIVTIPVKQYLVSFCDWPPLTGLDIFCRHLSADGQAPTELEWE